MKLFIKSYNRIVFWKRNVEYFDNLKYMVMWEVDIFLFREKIEEMFRLRDELITKGFNFLLEKEKGEYFDSNCIISVWNYYLF